MVNPWPEWVSSTSSITITSATSVATWNAWIVDDGTGCATSASSSTIWTSWTGADVRAVLLRLPQETPEEIRARETAHIQRLHAKRKEDELRVKARGRAKKLLMDNINGFQRESLEKNGYFDIMVAGKTYRIRQGTHGNVRLVENGKEVRSYCIQPDGVPDEDAMLAQKLWLETGEADFLRVANARIIA